MSHIGSIISRLEEFLDKFFRFEQQNSSQGAGRSLSEVIAINFQSVIGLICLPASLVPSFQVSIAFFSVKSVHSGFSFASVQVLSINSA